VEAARNKNIMQAHGVTNKGFLTSKSTYKFKAM
jgi:hypothetical protein